MTREANNSDAEAQKASLKSQQCREAALIMHATHNPVETTLAGRSAFMSRFEKLADPDGVLDEQERLRRAELLKRAYFVRLSRLSAESREKRRQRLARLKDS